MLAVSQDLGIPHGWPIALSSLSLARKLICAEKTRLWQLQICISYRCLFFVDSSMQCKFYQFFDAKNQIPTKKTNIKFHIPIGSMGRLYISLHGSCGIYISYCTFLGFFHGFPMVPQRRALISSSACCSFLR